MKTFLSLDRRRQEDVHDIMDIVISYLNLWGYRPTDTQLTHVREMLSMIVKQKVDK